VAKYKKKKTPTAESKVSAKTAPTTKSIGTNSQVSTPSATDTKKLKRVASGTLKLQFAGELILVKNAQKSLGGLFKRYAALFETLANLPKEERGLAYKIFTGLMLTSHAKKTTSAETRRKLFELKNQLFLTIANDRALRRRLEFKYLVSKNFRVVKYCESCQKTNAEQSLERHKWKYCKQCDVDHNFYNLLSMETRFPQGFARMFISNDQIAKLEYFKLPRRVNVDTLKEEAIIDQFHYNTRNLDAIELESVMSVHTKLLTPPTSSLSKSKLSENKSTKSK
jgi:hypothetical protein